MSSSRKSTPPFALATSPRCGRLVDNPRSVPNGPMPLAIRPCLEYAIYHSPLPFIRTLLEMGADP